MSERIFVFLLVGAVAFVIAMPYLYRYLIYRENAQAYLKDGFKKVKCDVELGLSAFKGCTFDAYEYRDGWRIIDIYCKPLPFVEYKFIGVMRQAGAISPEKIFLSKKAKSYMKAFKKDIEVLPDVVGKDEIDYLALSKHGVIAMVISGGRKARVDFEGIINAAERHVGRMTDAK